MFERSGMKDHNNIHRFHQPLIIKGGIAGEGDLSPIWMKAPKIGICDPGHAFELFDDFLNYLTTMNGWTTTGTGATIAADESVAGGVVLLTSSGTDNQAAILARTVEEFCVSAGKKLYFEARVKIAELNTDDTNICVGMTQGTVADAVPLLDDAGGAVIADDDAILWTKSDGGTVWVARTADGSAAYESTNGPTRDANWVRLGFIADPTQVDFYHNGNLVASHTTTLPTADEEMTICIGVKCGSANAETMQVDWVRCIQTR